MIDAIRAADADIVCLQEASERTIKFVRSRMSDRHPYISIVGQFGFAAKQDPTNVILDLSDVTSPTIILGDFNALSGAKAIGKLRSAGLIDSIASTHADADATRLGIGKRCGNWKRISSDPKT